MPTVTVLQGPRSVEVKRELLLGITNAFVDVLGIPADSVQVWIQETPTDSWGQGGVLTADA
jgi:4-oxalocrotonate tautomerase